MAVTMINPEGLPSIDLYRHVSVATGTRLVSIAGQVAYGPDGSTVGAGDYAAQVEQAYLNVATALAAVDATFDDVVRLTVYIVDWSPEKTPLLLEGVARVSSRLGTSAAPPFTGIGVVALAGPDLLVEVEATAVLD